MVLGIDASNLTEYGGLNHLLSILSYPEIIKKYGFKKVIIWCDVKIINLIYKDDLYKIVCIKNNNLFKRLLWQRYNLSLQAVKECDIVFAPGGVYISKYKPYALCVSHLYPYKNIIRMLEAFKNAMDNTGVKLKLLIAGNRDYKDYDNQILSTIEMLSIQESVCLLGSVSKKELRFLYSNCEIMIFPSPFENFAYTLVEAMACGAPIVSSNTTAMPETCRDAALYFDPYNTKEMEDKISLLLANETLRKTISKKSILRANELPDYEQVTIKILDIMKNLVYQNKNK